MEQVHLLQVYSELENIEEISDKFFLVSPIIKESKLQSAGSIIGSLFFNFIDQCAQLLDINSIEDIQECIQNQLAKQTFFNEEIAQLKNISKILSTISDRIQAFQACSQQETCKMCKMGDQQTCMLKKIQKNAKYLSNLENKFFVQDENKQFQFIDGVEFVASIYLMWRIQKLSVNKSQQELSQMNDILFSTFDKQKYLFKLQIEMICSLLNLNCEVFQEQYQKKVLVQIADSTQYRSFDSLYNNFIIYDESYRSFRLGYITFFAKKQQILQDKFHSQNDLIEILQTANLTCKGLKKQQELDEKKKFLQQLIQEGQTLEQVMKENFERIQQNDILFGECDKYLLQKQKEKTDLSYQIEQLKIQNNL